jgi:hypothetical protein
MVSRLAGVSVSSLTMDNTQYADNATAVAVDPYSEAYTAETQTTAPPGDSQPRMRSRSRSPAARDDDRDRGERRRSPPPKRPTHAPIVSFSPPSLCPQRLRPFYVSRIPIQRTCWASLASVFALRNETSMTNSAVSDELKRSPSSTTRE